MERIPDRETAYGYAPADQFRAAILEHLHGAMDGPDGLQRFIRRRLEMELPPAQIVDTVRGADA